MKKIKNVRQGFTLLELLVVVLIIGILASIALPQYQMAVTKAKVASILPLMRRWKDALAEYKLQHGDYWDENGDSPDGATLGVNWPSDWKEGRNGNEACGDNTVCHNDYWACYANNQLVTGEVYCWHIEGDFAIYFSQYDDRECGDVCPNRIICTADGDDGEKVCKALGGKLLEDVWVNGLDSYVLN